MDLTDVSPLEEAAAALDTGGLDGLRELSGVDVGPLPDEWARQLFSREGRAFTLRLPEDDDVEVRCEGSALLVASGETTLTIDPADLAVLQCVLAYLEALDGSAESGTWRTDEVAVILSLGPAELDIDGTIWDVGQGGMPIVQSNDEWPRHCLLGEDSWDLGPGGGGSPGNADSGEQQLVQVGPYFAIVLSADGETFVDDLDVHSVEEARAEFSRRLQTANDAGFDDTDQDFDEPD